MKRVDMQPSVLDRWLGISDIVNRRAVLGTIGSVASLGALRYATRPPIETLAVRIWFSERAAEYDAVADRIREYLERILTLDYWTFELSIGGVVSTSIEDGADVTRRGEWPRTVLRGKLADRRLEPVSGVNLLVTDGQMKRAPTGYGIPHVASVGGARYLDALESIEELFGSASTVDEKRLIAPNTTRVRTMQVLVHEIGHALGLRHDHGVAFRDGDTVIATPMLSSYAWDPEYDGDRSTCGTEYPDLNGRDRKLCLTFSACARRALASYSGGIFP